jgi:hypothetical protein
VAGGLTHRGVKALLALGAFAGASVLASGCSNQNGQALAKQACVYVNSSISMYESSLKDKNATQAKQLESKAYDRLQLALQPAALATSDNGQYQALMATISESAEIPEGVLVSALSQQCSAADSPTG